MFVSFCPVSWKNGSFFWSLLSVRKGIRLNYFYALRKQTSPKQNGMYVVMDEKIFDFLAQINCPITLKELKET